MRPMLPPRGLLLPDTPSGRMAAQSATVAAREKAIADNISGSGKYELSSDEALTTVDIEGQLEMLDLHIQARRARDPHYHIPRPVGWRISVLVMSPPKRTAGGLELASETVEQYAHKSVQGVVIAVGSGAYTDRERFPDGAWCAVGDLISFKRYDVVDYFLSNGQKIGLMNDTQPIGMIAEGRFKDHINV